MSELEELKRELAAIKQQLAGQSQQPATSKFPEELKEKYKKLLEEKSSEAQ